MLVVPVYQKFVTPNSEIYFQKNELANRTSGKVEENEKVVLLILREDQTKEDWTEDSFYPIGISGYVKEISPYGYITIKTSNRVNVDMVDINPDQSIYLTISRRLDTHTLDEETYSQKLQALKNEVLKVSEGFEVAEWFLSLIRRVDSMGTIAGLLSIWMKKTNEEIYALLEQDSEEERTVMLEQMLYEFLEVARVTGKATASQKEEYQNIYKESAIKKQMEYLQNELDAMHPENVTDIQKFEEKIANSGMNETARKEAEKVLGRLKQEGNHSQEAGMLYDYLDFVTSLSWKKEEAKSIDLKEARRVLDEDHYGLKKVKERMIQQIAVMNLKQEQKGSILLLVGAPGTGKTSIGRSVARALGREYVRVSLGGVRDEADIRGHRRTYIGAMPGRIMDAIQKSGVSNPVVVLDEIDKLGASYNGDPASALLEVLDPEQNDTFTDHYMNVPYDLSDVMFLCTANSLDTIPGPLLDRMEVIRFNGYTPDEKLHIAKEHLVPKSMAAMGVTADQVHIETETLEAIISDYTRESGVRGLGKRIDSLCRNAAVKIAEDPERVYDVTPDTLRDDLDMRPMKHGKILEQETAGIVTGLAWTQVGGEILYIESLFTPGSGHVTITGQLGDVMKESVSIAISVVKSLFPDKAELFKTNDLHVHVPAGAVPKDGPSAGITLTTALASLVTGIPVPTDIAMTGEISLRGAVTAIGGLPEKLMAAQRAGVTKVFIPQENEEDLRDVAAEVKEALEIIPVSHVSQVLEEIGLKEH